MTPATVDVSTATGHYSVLIGEGVAQDLGRLLDERSLGTRRIVVSNPVVWRLHGDTVQRAVPGAIVVLVPDGERHKILPTVLRIYDSLVRAEADRASVILAVGGGVIGDMAGFAAATFLRGLTLVQVPTTLLAQVDASIGGKVGVNLAAGKNLVGAFYPPALVVTDCGLLSTLPRREYRAGLYEVIKYGFACSADLFARLGREAAHVTDSRPQFIEPIVTECCRIKARVVSADERESGPRRVLNFGHTAGHAIEAVTGFRRFRHGEAVAWGMLIAAHVATARGLLPDRDRLALRGLIMQLGPLPPVADLAIADLLDSMRRDKKVADGRLHFVLPTAIGSTTIADDVSARELTAALKEVGCRERKGRTGRPRD
jgi:3-dehydroquinate synthase